MIEVGEYVRTEDGKIGKVLGFCECDECQRRGYLEPIIDNINIYITKYDKDNDFEGIKHSKNIIDLMEVGDYVNGEKIKTITNDRHLLLYRDVNLLDKYREIKTILTKEQYEANCYKVEEE